MKKTILINLFILFAYTANAQINIGAPGAIKPSSFKKSDMEYFKNSITYFVMRDSDKPQQAILEGILKEVWMFNKIELIDFDQYKKNVNKENAIFFGLRSYNYNSDYVRNADLFGKYAQYSDMYIQLWRNFEVKKPGNLEEQLIARIEITLPDDAEKQLKEKISIDAFEYLCKERVNVPEWNAGLLKNYLQVINKYMVENKSLWVFQSDVNKEQIKNLKKETLYVDEGAMKRLDSREKESPLKSYTYKYEMIKMEDLGNKILESEMPFFYLRVYIQSTDKMITVVNSKTGEIIYSDYKGQAYYFKEKDVKNLVEAIGK